MTLQLLKYFSLSFIVLFCLTQLRAQNSTPTPQNPEYKQYRYLADAYFNEGDYEKAARLYKLCLAVPTHEKDAYATEKTTACQRILTAQNNFTNALKTKSDINPELQTLRQSLSINPKDLTARQRIALQLEQDGDTRFQRGDYETAMSRYVATQQITSTQKLALKMQRANELYEQKAKKPIAQYTAQQQNRQIAKPEASPVPRKISIAAENEYTRYRDEADAAYQRGEYDLARRKYVAATQVPGYESDKYADQQATNAARLNNLNKRLTETQGNNDSKGTLAYAREAFKLNPNNATLKQQAAQAAEAVGDEMLGKELFADAKKYYEEATQYGATNMTEKVTQAEQKVAEKRQENEKLRQSQGDFPGALTASKKETRARHRSNDPILGVAVAAESYFVFPALRNGTSKVTAPPQMALAGGGQLILFPTKTLSATVGINYLPVKIITANDAKTARLESFDLKMLQIPVGGRFSKPLGDTDYNLHLQAGATFNLPRKLSYTNYTMDTNNTDLAMVSKQTLGFYGGVGLSRTLSERRSLSLMLNYQHTDNLLDLNYTDTATNRSRASMALQGLSIQLIFKVF